MDCLARIKNLLAERGWSMYQLSHASGIPQSTLSNLFLRCNCPSVPTLSKICDAFGITLAEFFREGTAAPDEETELVARFRAMNAEERAALLTLIRKK